MGNFAENLNLGNRFRPPCLNQFNCIAPSSKKYKALFQLSIHEQVANSDDAKSMELTNHSASCVYCGKIN